MFRNRQLALVSLFLRLRVREDPLPPSELGLKAPLQRPPPDDLGLDPGCRREGNGPSCSCDSSCSWRVWDWGRLRGGDLLRFPPAPRGYVHISSQRFPFEPFGEPRHSIGLTAAYGPFLPAVYHPFVLREAG